jgi:hypothetical protein
VPVAHGYNARYLGSCDGENWVLRPARTNSSWDPISTIARAKWTGGVAQVVVHTLCMNEALSSNPSPTKKKEKSNLQIWEYLLAYLDISIIDILHVNIGSTF